MRIAILGPVEVRDDNGDHQHLQPHARSILTILVEADGKRVSAATMIDLLSGEQADKTPRSRLTTAIGRLRKELGPDRVLTKDDGYQLVLRRDDDIDLRVFRAWVDAAERLATSDVEVAAGLYASALGLWGDRPLSGLPPTDAMQIKVAGLMRERQDAIESWAQLLLRLRRYTELTAALPAHIAADPWNEHLVHLLMLALYLDGRKGEALHVYQQTRNMLLAETGDPEPGPELQHTHEQICTGVDETLILGAVPVVESDQAVIACGADQTMPSTWRMTSYLVGMSHCLPVDRLAVEKIKAVMPSVPELSLAGERYVSRVVREAAKKQGTRQFLVLGAGLYSRTSTLEVARRVAPGSKVVMTNHDPSVVAYANVTDPELGFMLHNILEPDSVLDAATAGGLDLTQPVLVLIPERLNWIPDELDPQSKVGELMDALAPGSGLAVAIGTHDGLTDAVGAQLGQIFDSLPVPIVLRTLEEAREFYAGTTIVNPEGLTDTCKVLAVRPGEIGPWRAYGAYGVKE